LKFGLDLKNVKRLIQILTSAISSLGSAMIRILFLIAISLQSIEFLILLKKFLVIVIDIIIVFKVRVISLNGIN
jgi:hypothetical protein